MKYRPPLDGLRAFCAAAVFLYHASYGHTAGVLGVDVFFVLSGYLITRILLDDYDEHGRVRYARFYARRARRLLPAVFVALVLVLALAPPEERSGFPRILPPVLLYYVNWCEAFNRPIAFVPHFWSLSTEEQFYLAWPIGVATLATLGRRRMAFVTGGLVVAFAAARAVLSGFPPPLEYLFGYFSTFSRADELLVGALAGIIHGSADERWRSWSSRWARRLAWPAATGLLLCVAFGGHNRTWLLRGGFTAVALASAFVIVHGASGEPSRLNRFLESRPLVWAGKRSYGIYVFHLPIIAAFEPLRDHHSVVNLLAITAARAVATLVVAWASYGLIESRVLAAGVRERARLQTL